MSDGRAADDGSGAAPSRRPAAQELRLELGPYAGLTVEEVVQLDPEHARKMVAAEVGSAEIRARAARLLLARPRGVDLRRGWSHGFVAASVVGLVAWGVYTAYERVGPSPAPSAVLMAVGRPPARERADTMEMGFSEANTTRTSPSVPSTASASGRGGRDALRPESSAGVAGERPAMSSSGVARLDSAADDAQASDSAADETQALDSAVDETQALDSAADETQACGKRATGSIDAQQAEESPGTDAAVEFRVVGTHDTGKVTFLNSHDPYRDHFYVAVFPDDYDAFPSPPSEYFHGRCVVVQGRIELYRGTAQIVLRRPSDIVIVGD